MIFYEFRISAKRLVINYFSFARIIIITFFTKPKGKKVFLDISEIDLNRYLYNLVLFFKLNDYTVYIPKNKKLIGKLVKKNGEFKYASWILNNDVKIGIPKGSENVCFHYKEQLSNDYFNENFYYNPDCYRVPMSQYPLMYSHLDIESNIDVLQKRKKSLFMSGNFDAIRYKEISEGGFFDILNRREVVDFIYEQKYYHNLASFDDLMEFIQSPIDCKVILVDTCKDFSIDLNKLMEILKAFDFFLALPGIVIPQSHNLIEAMAMGCIPIMHKTYANLFSPSLKHDETALIYENKEDLDRLVKEIFSKGDDVIVRLRENVIDYYNTYLSPKAVIDTITKKKYSKVIIQAEHVSLGLVKLHKHKHKYI